MGWTRRSGFPPVNYSHRFIRKRLELKRFDDICGGLQQFSEDFVSGWMQSLLRKLNRHTVLLSGGFFMNVKVNQKIAELEEVHRLFIFPSCGDETNTFGAAYGHIARLGNSDSIQAIDSLYLGPDYSDRIPAVVEGLAGTGMQVTRSQDVASNIGELLAGGEIVARWNGREEFGARALGNRSILADARVPGVIETINDMIKKRDFWMPFASSVLAEDADRYIRNPKRIDAPYMILSFASTELGRTHLTAGMHPRDKSIRVQTVDDRCAPGYADIIREYRRRTDIGGILNTSFNLHGFPIVSTPMDAVDVFLRSGLRMLALGDYLIRKPST